jgi:hypothetical protein
MYDETTAVSSSLNTFLLSPCPNWDPPLHPPSRKRVCPSPEPNRVRHYTAGEEVGAPIRTTGEKAQHSCLLCGPDPGEKCIREILQIVSPFEYLQPHPKKANKEYCNKLWKNHSGWWI